MQLFYFSMSTNSGVNVSLSKQYSLPGLWRRKFMHRLQGPLWGSSGSSDPLASQPARVIPD